MPRFIRRAAMVRLKKGEHEARVAKEDARVVADYVADGWEIVEEIPEEVFDTQGVVLPGFSSKVVKPIPIATIASDDGGGPPLPGLDVEQRRRSQKGTKK